jgi:hypothetical protein
LPPILKIKRHPIKNYDLTFLLETSYREKPIPTNSRVVSQYEENLHDHNVGFSP